MNELDKIMHLDLHLATLRGVHVYVGLLPHDGE